MTAVRDSLVRFGRFWYRFVVGDDWAIAVGVIAALAAAYGVHAASIPAWWLVPAAVVAVLAVAVVRANRREP